jgi:hypothetical protein
VGTFNGVTEWLDHRQTRQNSNQRLNSAWFGESARIKSRALAAAVDKMAGWDRGQQKKSRQQCRLFF